MMDLYKHPKYYEIAFSFRDIPKEVDVFEECFRRYSKVAVRRVLDLACGHAPHMEEIARRGYDYIGLDLSAAMVAYDTKKAQATGIDVTLLRGDMRKFTLEKPVDFAYTMIGSVHAESTEDVLSHLTSVSQALRPGGLYFLDWCINFTWLDPKRESDTWSVEQDGIKVNVHFEPVTSNRVTQVCSGKVIVDVEEDGRKFRLEGVDIRHTIFPQEFLLLIEKVGTFEFIGWWNNWDLDQPIEDAEEVNRPITLIRRIK